MRQACPNRRLQTRCGSDIAVRPVERPVGEVEFEVDGFRQILVQEFDIFAVRWSLAFGNLEIGAKNASLTGIVRALLSPIKFAGFDVERDAHAPFLYDLPRARVAFARVDKRFDPGAIQVSTHDSHAFTIAPVKLAVLLIELQLLRGESTSRRNNVRNVASVKIRALDGTVIGTGVAHVGPIEVTCFDVDNDAVGNPPSLTHDDLEVGAIGIRGKHFAAART